MLVPPERLNNMRFEDIPSNFQLRWWATFSFFFSFIRSSRFSSSTSIGFLPLQRSQYLQESWNMCNKQIGFATLDTLKSLSTLIFKNKCMIRFADPLPNQGGVRIYQMAGQTPFTTTRTRTVSSKQGLFQRQLWLKRKKKHTHTQQYDSHELIVSHNLLKIITTTVLVGVMFEAYLRLTEKVFAAEIRHMIEEPCCAVGATL